MTRMMCGALAACAMATLVVHAQKTVKFDAKMDYVLTVEKQPAAQINAWWRPFLSQNSLDGYCFDLNTLPLADRPQIADKAKILKVGGAAQLVQVAGIPPSGKTVWHVYGWEGEGLFYVLSGRGQTEYKSPGGLPSNKYTWKKNSLFAIPVDHQMQRTNLDPRQPVRMLAVTGCAIKLSPCVEDVLRSGKENPGETAEERTGTLAGTPYRGHSVGHRRGHPRATRAARGARP